MGCVTNRSFKGFNLLLLGAALLLFLAVAFPATAEARSEVDRGDCGPNATYVLYDDGLLDIRGSGAIDEHPWTRSAVKQVSIPEGITEIGEGFLGGTPFTAGAPITSITIPSTVKTIDDQAFMSCDRLRTVVINGDPSQLSDIGGSAFHYCSSLESFSWVSDPSLRVEIGVNAFGSCSKLSSFDVPEGLYSNSEGFGSCPFVIASGTLGFGIYQGGPFYFLMADGTLKIVGWGEMNSFSSAGSVPWASSRSSISNIEIGSNVASIGNYAFYGCGSVSSVTIPNRVGSIGSYAFASSGVKNINFQEQSSIEEIAGTAFDNTSDELLIDCAWNGIPAVFADEHGIEAIRKPTSIENAVVVIDPPLEKPWTGKEIEPGVTVVLNGEQLREDEDYSVTYEDNIEPGTAIVRVEGEGHYWRSVTKEFHILQPKVVYSAAVEGSTSWQESVTDGEMAGTSGLGLRMEGLKMELEDLPCEGGIRYQAQIQSIGWQDWKSDGEVAGFNPKVSGGKRLETIKIELTGEIAEYYDIYYHLQVQRFGWMGWAKNGEPAGTVGYSFRVEAIEAVLIPKETGERDVWVHTVATPEANMLSYARTNSYDNRAWQGPKGEGDVSGTRGKVKSAILFGLPQAAIPSQYKGNSGIRYQVYQNNKWSKWYADDAVAGDKKNPIRGIKVELTGNMAKDYDVYYRVEVKDGKSACWLGWAKNGAIAGQKNINLEQVEVAVVKKGDPAPPTATNNSKQRWVLERWPCTWPKPAYRF